MAQLFPLGAKRFTVAGEIMKKKDTAYGSSGGLSATRTISVSREIWAGQPNTLVRSIGRWSLTALVINSIIGSGVFGLPSVVSSHLGRMAPFAYFIAGAGMAVIAGCLSEVASQFRETGGPYLYARETLGRFWGDRKSTRLNSS